MGARVVIGYATFHNSNIRVSKSRRHYELTWKEEEEEEEDKERGGGGPVCSLAAAIERERMSPVCILYGDYLQ